MRKREFPMNLKLFGHDGTSGDGTGTGEGEGTGDNGDGGNGGGGQSSGETPPGSEALPFDDYLKLGSNQAEFDRRIQKSLETQKLKLDVIYSDKATEAEKLAKMTKEEKAVYLHHKQVKELQDREAGITRRELMAEAKNTLAEKNLPVELSEVLNFTDAEACSKSIEAVEKAFQKAVESAVQDRLKGGKPQIKAPSAQSYTKEQVSMMSPEEINKNWEHVSQSMATWTT